MKNEKIGFDSLAIDNFSGSIINSIRHYELVSLDIFDTVLFRLCAHPTDVFLEVAKEAAVLGYLRKDIAPESFRELRIMAEKQSRYRKEQLYGHREVQLIDIYQQLPQHIGDSDSMMNLEVEIEKKRCYVNPDILSVIRTAKENKLKVALVSDMYLSSMQIKEILSANHFPLELIDSLIVSNEYGTDKVSGGLFDILLTHFPNVPRENVLHIGDNKTADIDGALKAGISSSYYNIVPHKIDSIYEREQIRYGTIVPQICSLRKLAGSRQDEDFWFTTGATIMGPVLSVFSEWVVDVCLKEKKTAVFPFMREGMLLGKLIQNVVDRRGLNIRVEPFYISRQASYLAGLKVFNDEEMQKLFERNNFTVEDLFTVFQLEKYFDLFERYGLIPLTKCSEIEIKKGQNLRTAIFDFFQTLEIKEHISSLIKEKKSLFLQYLETLTKGQTDFVTVDLGFKGTIQGFVESALGSNGDKNRIHLLALGSDHTKQLIMSGVDIRGWLGNAGENDAVIKKIMRSPEVIEELILADCGSTIGYEKNAQGQINPVLEERSLFGQEREWKERFRDGVFYFQQLWSDLASQKPFVLNELLNQKAEWISLMLRMIEWPTVQEAKHLGMLHHDDNFGSSHYSMICNERDEQLLKQLGPEAFLQRSLYGYHVTNAYWPQGVITNSFPAFLFQKYVNESEGNSYLAVMSRFVHEIEELGFTSIVMYGAGEVGEAFLEIAQLTSLNVDYVVDKKESLWNQDLKGVPITSLNQVMKAGNHVYAVASLSFSREIGKDIMAAYEHNPVTPVILEPI